MGLRFLGRCPSTSRLLSTPPCGPRGLMVVPQAAFLSKCFPSRGGSKGGRVPPGVSTWGPLAPQSPLLAMEPQSCRMRFWPRPVQPHQGRQMAAWPLLCTGPLEIQGRGASRVPDLSRGLWLDQAVISPHGLKSRKEAGGELTPSAR